LNGPNWQLNQYLRTNSGSVATLAAIRRARIVAAAIGGKSRILQAAKALLTAAKARLTAQAAKTSC
jgi:hypothetical protein